MRYVLIFGLSRGEESGMLRAPLFHCNGHKRDAALECAKLSACSGAILMSRTNQEPSMPRRDLKRISNPVDAMLAGALHHWGRAAAAAPTRRLQ